MQQRRSNYLGFEVADPLSDAQDVAQVGLPGLVDLPVVVVCGQSARRVHQIRGVAHRVAPCQLRGCRSRFLVRRGGVAVGPRQELSSLPIRARPRPLYMTRASGCSNCRSWSAGCALQFNNWGCKALSRRRALRDHRTVSGFRHFQGWFHGLTHESPSRVATRPRSRPSLRDRSFQRWGLRRG